MNTDLIIVFCAQAVLIIGLFAWLRTDMHKLGESLGTRIDALDKRLDAIDRRLQEVEQRLSRLEGKVDFIEGYITRRNEPSPAE
ncbi:MAG: hypothetical protein OXT64_12445 [Gammaproteobacteria bacterium]|nr:hypothetical protein [Gammaproteobacteria bacterium]